MAAGEGKQKETAGGGKQGKQREKGAGEGGKQKGKGEGGKKNANLKSTELHTAARNGDLARLEALLADEAMAKELNTADQHHRSPLHLAAFFGRAKVAELLLEKRADDKSEATDGFLPMHFAAQCGHLEMLQLLLGRPNTQVDCTVRKGKKSALHLAVAKGHTGCVGLLLSRGASVELKTGGGQSAVDLCRSEELRLLLSQEPPAKRRACDVQASAGAVGAAPAAGAPAAATIGPPLAPASGAPTAGAAAGSSTNTTGLGMLERPLSAPVGALASGPYKLAQVDVETAERLYPPGIAALADAHWAEKPGLTDGEVWSVGSCEVRGHNLHLRLLRSSRRLRVYTEQSEDAALLPASARCGACGISVLAQGADGPLVFMRGADGLWQPPVASRTLDSSDLSATLVSVLAGWGAEPSSALVLALLEGAPGTGHKHELLCGVRLAMVTSEVKATREGQELAFVTEGECPGSVSLQEFVGDGASLSAITRLALALWRGTSGASAGS